MRLSKLPRPPVKLASASTGKPRETTQSGKEKNETSSKMYFVTCQKVHKNLPMQVPDARKFVIEGKQSVIEQKRHRKAGEVVRAETGLAWGWDSDRDGGTCPGPARD